MQVNRKSITLGNNPKFFGVPIIVCVLPEPVWPYTNTHPLYPIFFNLFIQYLLNNWWLIFFQLFQKYPLMKPLKEQHNQNKSIFNLTNFQLLLYCLDLDLT